MSFLKHLVQFKGNFYHTNKIKIYARNLVYIIYIYNHMFNAFKMSMQFSVLGQKMFGKCNFDSYWSDYIKFVSHQLYIKD
jgi:hypothetical protein